MFSFLRLLVNLQDLCFLSAIVHYFHKYVLQDLSVVFLLFCRSDTFFFIPMQEMDSGSGFGLNQCDDTSQFAWDSPGLGVLSVVTISSTSFTLTSVPVWIINCRVTLV